MDYRSALELPPASAARYSRGELEGQPVVATFFATWCFPCLGQLQLFAGLHREYASRGLKVVAVGMDLEGAKVLRPFAEQSNLPFPIVVADEALRKGETQFGPVTVLPSTVILARDGSVVAAWPGLAPADGIRAAIEQAL